jgi:hypothetical protein
VVAEFQCPLRSRIGSLIPREREDQPIDTWWRFDLSSDPLVIGQEVADAVVMYSLPVLERLPSLTALRDYLQGTRGHRGPVAEDVYLAIIEALVDNRGEAARILDELYAGIVGTRAHTLRVAERLGICSPSKRAGCQSGAVI